MKNKKGAEGMPIGILVAIVLAILILVFLALGFTSGWSNFLERIRVFSPKANVDTIKSACQYACVTQQTYEYCCLPREVIYINTTDQKTIKGEFKCTDDLIRPSDCSMECPEGSCPS